MELKKIVKASGAFVRKEDYEYEEDYKDEED